MQTDNMTDALPISDREYSPELSKKLKNLDPENLTQLLKKLGSSIASGSELIIRALKECGIKRLSAIAGTPLYPILTEASGQSIRLIGYRHQMAATMAAAADNFSKGCIIHVVMASAGPAITNTVTAIHFANQNNWPLLVIGTRRSLIDEGCGYFQEWEAVSLMTPITKMATTISKASEIMPCIHKAIETAINDITGPVYLEIPENVISEKAIALDLTLPTRKIVNVSAPAVDKVLGLLRKANSPLLCLGEGLRWDIDTYALRAFIEREQLPFITTPNSRGIVSETHPLCANNARRTLPLECDLFFMTGAWFDWRFRMGVEINPDASVIHVHPETNQLGRNVSPKISIACNAGVFTQALCVQSETSQDLESPARSFWISRVQQKCKEAEKKRLATLPDEQASPMHPRAFFQALQLAMPASSMIAIDGSISLSYAQFALKPTQPFSWFDPGWNGLIGGSLGIAIGLKLANPHRPVFAIVSDTSFGMSGFEFETCVRHRIPIIAIVANNDGISGSLRQKQLGDFEQPIAQFKSGIAYHKIAEELGAHGFEIKTADETALIVEQALALDKPICINAYLDPDAPSPGIW